MAGTRHVRGTIGRASTRPMRRRDGPGWFGRGAADGADDCSAGLRGVAESIMTDLVLQARVVEGSDAMTWFDLITATTPPIPTVNWSHVENGLITRIRVTFDPRPLLGG